MKTSTPRYVKIGIAGALLIALGLTAAWFFRTTPSTIEQDLSSTTVSATDSKQIAATVQLHLPGTQPIDALIEDYDLATSIWTIVSKQYPLSDQQYRPSDLIVTGVPVMNEKSTDEKLLRSVLQADVTAMFTAAQSAGHDIVLASGFRSYSLQQRIFSGYSQSYGDIAANKFSARPGQSEHQTGLALDIAYVNRECYLAECFGEKPAGQWLAANAYSYGFVMRYPADKTTATQYQYEPWHFRYVGRSLATALHESGLTLDEARPYLQTALAELRAQKKL